VKFIEDESPSDLTVVNVHGTIAIAKEIDGLIDGAISLGIEKSTISSLGASSTSDMSKSVTLSPQVPFLPSILTPFITNKGIGLSHFCQFNTNRSKYCVQQSYI